jgi:hypothetical protein
LVAHALVLLGLLALAPGAAQAAPSIESIKYVTVFDPPGGGTPIVRETAGPNGGQGLTSINIDNDADSELTAGTNLSFDAATLQVTGQLSLTRGDFGGPLGGALSSMPVWVEAVAVLKSTVDGVTKRQNVAIGYDARGSNAPGRFALDLGSCSTPDCQSTPTPCVAPCKGTKTTLSLNVTAPAGSLRLTGELSRFAAGGGREDPTRAEIDFTPVPGSSSPVVFTIWSTETKDPNVENAPTATSTRISMNGNKDAMTAAAHICRLPKETYTPAQPGHTACDAAGYAGQIDSRILDATLDRLPRDVASGHVAVTATDNGLGANGGRTALIYDASQPVQNIDVTDRVVTWTADGKREAQRTYNLDNVPTSATLELFDDSELAPAPITKRQAATYTGGAITAADVFSTERLDGVLTKRESLVLRDVPTHLKVTTEETEEGAILPGLFEPGFERHSSQTVGLAEATSPIGLIEYTSTDGETSAVPPADMGNAYVYTNKPEDGVQFVKVRLPSASEGIFTIARFEKLPPDNSPFGDPEQTSGLELLKVDGKLAPTAFRTLAQDGARTYDVRVENVPDDVNLTLEPQKGRIDYTGSATIGKISVHADDPNGLFERAHSLDVVAEGVPTDVDVTYPHDGNKDIDLDVDGGEIGKLEITALNENDSVPADVLGPEDDGVILRDVEGLEDVDDEYVIFARVRGLRRVAVREFEHDRDTEEEMVTTTKQFVLDSTARRIFVYDGHTTSEVFGPSSRNGSGWGDDDPDCEKHAAGKVLDKQRAVIENLAPGTELNYDKRHAYGQRECYEHVNYSPAGPGPPSGTFTHTKDIRYSADVPAGRMDFLIEDSSSDQYIRLDSLPTALRFCRSGVSHDCLPGIGNGYGTSEGSLAFDASDYVNVNMVDCEDHFVDGSCETANSRVTDLHLKKIEFWGDQDADGISGDLYLNTTDWETGDNQPFRGGRIKTDSIDFRFGDGFYARGAHIYWDNIWDDEQSDWSPDGSGGKVYCPSGTNWQVKATGSWWGTTEDWCNSGSAN